MLDTHLNMTKVEYLLGLNFLRPSLYFHVLERCSFAEKIERRDMYAIF